MKKLLRTTSLIGLLSFGLSCTGPIRLVVIPDNTTDTLFVFTDDTLPKKFNKDIKYNFDETTRLFKYPVFENHIVVFRQFEEKCGTLRYCEDSVKAHLNISYLKLIYKSGKTYTAKNKGEIIELFKMGNDQGIVTF